MTAQNTQNRLTRLGCLKRSISFVIFSQCSLHLDDLFELLCTDSVLLYDYETAERMLRTLEEKAEGKQKAHVQWPGETLQSANQRKGCIHDRWCRGPVTRATTQSV